MGLAEEAGFELILDDLEDSSVEELKEQLEAERELCDKMAAALENEVVYGSPGDLTTAVLAEYRFHRGT